MRLILGLIAVPLFLVSVVAHVGLQARLMSQALRKLTHFIIAEKEGEFVPAKAKIEGDTVVVWSDAVKAPAAARYGWENAAEPNLFNKEGLPASPVRTDKRPGETFGKY